MNSFVLKRILSFTASIMCFHASLFAQCENPVIESITFTEKYYCSSETPEMILDFGSTKASSIAVFMADDMENSIFEVSFPLLSNILLPFRGVAGDYFDFKERVFKDIYVFAWNDEGCKSEPKKIQVPYNNINFNITWDPVLFCEGGDDIGEFHIGVGDVEIDSDITLNVYDKAGNILEPKEVVHSDKNCGWQGGCYEYTYLITNNPNERYYWDLDLSKNRCASNAGGGKTEIERFMTSPHKLSLDIEALPNVQKTSNGYVTCEGETVKLSINEENISNSVSTEIATKVEKPCTVCGWVWEYRKGSGSFTTYTKDNVLNIDPTIDDSYQFRVRSKVGSNYDACPQVVSNVISIDREKAPKFTLKTTPDCDNKQVELSLVSSQTYEPSQITATANGKPISFVGKKATVGFTKDIEFEVSVAGEVCPAVTKTANVKYDCVEDIEFSLDVDKEVICEGDEVTLTLVATGEYDDSEVFATADGKSIKLTDGKYTAALSLPTKFEMVIVNDVGVTRLEKDVYVESKLEYTIETKVDCDKNEVELHLDIDPIPWVWPKTITSTANGKTIEFSGGKATTTIEYLFSNSEDKNLEVSIAGEACPAIVKNYTVEYDCVDDIEFTLDVDKEVVCENDEATLTLVATGEYDDTKVSATANGKPITLTDGKYTSALAETTKFVVAIANADGTKTTLQKSVEVDAKPNFSLSTNKDCDNNEVELTIVSDQTYDASQITATANGKPISFAGKKATVDFTKDVNFEVSVSGEICPAVTKTATAEYDCVKPCPVIESVTFPEDYICSNEQPEFTVDLGSTKATSFYVYREDNHEYENPETDLFEATTDATSNYTIKLEKDSYYYTDKYGNFPDMYVIAAYGECKSEPVKITMPYQSVLLSMSWSSPLFCEGGDEITLFRVSFPDWQQDITPYVDDSDGNIIELEKMEHQDISFSYRVKGGRNTYYYYVSNDPNKKYYLNEASKNRCAKGTHRYLIERYITEPHKLSIDVTSSSNIEKTSGGYVVCEGEEVTLSFTENNITNITSYCIDNGSEKKDKCDWFWEYRENGEESFTPFTDSQNSEFINSVIDNSLEIRARMIYVYSAPQFDGCPEAVSNIIAIDKEKNPEFTLETTKDCVNKEVELTIVSDQTYDASQITATANGKPISLTDKKATVEFTKDIEFEVSVAGKACPAVTKTATAEYDCVETEFSLETSYERVCEEGEVILYLIATGPYDATKVSATANGKPIVLTEGTYKSTVTETTKFEVVIENANGTKTTLDKTVEVDTTPDFSLEHESDCENKQVEFSFVSEQTFEPSQISATLNGAPVLLTGSKYKSEITGKMNLEVKVDGKSCVTVTKGVNVSCAEIGFTIKTDKDVVCEGDEVEMSLETTDEYDASKITATANGKPIALTDGKYTSVLTETTIFEIVIVGFDGKEGKIGKRVEVEKKPDFSLEATPDCEAKEVELSLVSDAAYDPSQITATANGKPISFAGNKATAEFVKDIEFEVTVASELCPAVTKNVTAEYDCVETKFSIEVDKESICEGDDVELTLVASGTYDETKVSATANGKPIKLTDGKYISALTETTKFEMVISNFDGTETKLEKTVDVEHPSSFTINTDKTTVCDGEDVTLTTSFSSTNFDESSIIISNANETLATGQQSVVITPLSSMIVKAEALTTSGCKMNAEPVSIFVSNISLRDVPGDTTVCEGDEIKLSVSDKNDYKYNWTILGDTVSNSNQMELICIKTTNVKLEASLNDCKNVYDFVINVAPTPRIVSVEDKSDYEYEIIAEGGTGDYQYDLGDGYSSSSTFINHLLGKIYHIYVKDELGCKADTIYKIPIVEIEIPIFFTPNGDGDNDLWVVKNLDKYPSANVRLYDRWGKQLVSTTSAEFEGWDGTYNGNALPSTDYWYEIDIEEIDKIYTGHFTLIRGEN